MAMEPWNYAGIEAKYNQLVPKVELILSPKTPITFTDKNIDILMDFSGLYQQLESAVKNLKVNSNERAKYEAMLYTVSYLNNQLAFFVKDLYHRRIIFQ